MNCWKNWRWPSKIIQKPWYINWPCVMSWNMKKKLRTTSYLYCCQYKGSEGKPRLTKNAIQIYSKGNVELLTHNQELSVMYYVILSLSLSWLIFLWIYTNPAIGILDFCKQKLMAPPIQCKTNYKMWTKCVAQYPGTLRNVQSQNGPPLVTAYNALAGYAKTFWASSDIWSVSSDISLNLTAALCQTFS